MKNKIRSNYFIIVKAAGIFGLTFFGLARIDAEPIYHAFVFLISAVFLFCAVVTELKRDKRKLLLATEGILAAVSIFLFDAVGIYYLAVAILDIVSVLYERQYDKKYLYFLGYAPLAVVMGLNGAGNVFFHAVMLTLLLFFYYQEKCIVDWYRQAVDENFVAEHKLKRDMEESRQHHKKELNQSRLHYENVMLEEKQRIAQALHDKLGHNINGSLYKLEAARLLVDKKPWESRTILEEVIDSLRGSMDEIRIILRNERPDKKRMAILSLQALCEECEEQYHIKANLNITQGEREIPEKIWEIILDNTFEAVTNSLKYAECTGIDISIIVLGEVVRCTIRDNGKGSESYEDGMGISGMKKRVRDVKGYFDVEAGEGFTINMILPLKL